MSKQEFQRRENWNNWAEFFFSVLGSMISLATIWRFPYLCYKNGGGAFLVPFFIFMLLINIPVLFLELSYSQYSNLGPGKVWIMCPLFKGVGYGTVILSGMISLYYNVVLAWTLYYIFISMHPVLPWIYCNNPWNDCHCYETTQSDPFQWQNVSSINYLTGPNNSDCFMNNSIAVSASEQFWKYKVLEMTSDIDDIGSIRFPLLLCLAVAWFTVFLGIFNGIKSFGKLTYIAAILPYILLTILLTRAATLPGSRNGLLYYLLPDWGKLKEFSVWKDAAIQIFYSSSISVGGIATLASYNDFHTNCQRDAIIFPIIQGISSWFVGLTTFCILGYMAHISNIDISHVISQGVGVPFVVYPEALSTLPFPQLWAALFFLTLFVIGISTEFVYVLTLVTAFTDAFPTQLGNKKRKIFITGIICFVCFLLGIPCVTQGGIHIVQILDRYCSSLSILFLTLLEIIGVCYLYGFSQLYDDVTMMLGYKPFFIWEFLCKYIAPTTVFVCFIMSLSAQSYYRYDTGEPYPIWICCICVIIGLIPIIPFPAAALIEILSLPGSFIKRLKTSIIPSLEWKPSIEDEKSEESFLLTTIKEED